MRNDVSVHRVVKNKKMAGQYIEPHRHNFFHYIYCLSGHTCVRLGRNDLKPDHEPGSGSTRDMPLYHEPGHFLLPGFEIYLL